MQKINNVIILRDGLSDNVQYDITMSEGTVVAIDKSTTEIKEPMYATGGYIDIHTHGGLGHDFFECTQEAADSVGAFHLQNGTTSFCATSVATPLAELDVQCAKIRGLKQNYSTMLGLHLEGPFISVKKKGAQPECNIRAEYTTEDAKFFEDNADILKIVTMCPHTKNAVDLVAKLDSLHIIAHAGHDDSIYPEIIDCVSAGLTGATHIYCASSGLNRRAGDITKYMGLNETALASNKIFTEVIADGQHISRELFLYIYNNKGFRNMCVVSDSLSAAGMPKGTYVLGEDIAIYNNGEVVLLADKSALAGSITPLAKMVQNMVSYGVPIAEAVYMANQAPASHLKMPKLGKIGEGLVADIVLIDNFGSLKAVYKAGSRVN
ncbi:MAG: amidohydrolase family protein [Bacillota bacterium]